MIGLRKKAKGFTQHLASEIICRGRYFGRRRRPDSELGAGFTIVELLIATTAFSVVLLLSLTAFLQIGQIFYKGVTITQTQQATRKIYDDITSSYHASNNVTPQNSASGGRQYFCVGSSRYSYILGKKVDQATENTTTNFGLIKDKLPGGSPCANPFDAPGIVPIQPVHDELLGNNMRLSNVLLVPISSTLYHIDVTIAYGEDSVLNNAGSMSPDCQKSLSNARFCSVSKLSTAVNLGF